MQSTTQTSKAQILVKFQQILDQKNKIDSKVATKEEEAEKEKGKQILETASSYTVDSIVKSLADLQLDFGNTIIKISEKLRAESSKLDELKRGIDVENQQLQDLQKIRVVADALHILTQENQEKLNLLQQNSTLRQEALEKEQTAQRKIWEKEQQEFEASVKAEQERIAKTRQQEEEDYDQLDGDQRSPALEHQADQYQSGTHRVGDPGTMHPRIEVRQTNDPDPANHRE